MIITYDKEADAAYVYLQDIGLGGVSWTYSCDPRAVKGMINLDFDVNDRLIGIEILEASKRLPQEIYIKLSSLCETNQKNYIKVDISELGIKL